MKKNIINYNSKGEVHGYQEWYYGGLHVKGFIHNEIGIDYQEFYYYSGESEKVFHI